MISSVETLGADAPPPHPKRASLVTRMTGLNVLVLGAALLVCFGLIVSHLWMLARDQQAQAAENNAQVLANSLAPMMAFQDEKAANKELRAFGQRNGVLELRVIDSDGHIFARWTSAEPGSYPSTEVDPAHRGHESGLRELHAWAPMALHSEPLGHVELRESFASLDASVVRVLMVGLPFIMVAVGVAGLVLHWVQRRSLRPLLALAELAEQVASDQDYSRRATIYQADEVGRLADRFNELLKRAEIAHASLNLQLAQEQLVGQELQRLAHACSLTGLPNRLAFNHALSEQVQRVRDTGHCLALMFIDLDHFKAVNDTYGHESGDRVLCIVAQRMSQVLRERDVLYRLGGDEFALIVNDLGQQAVADHLAQRLIATVNEPISVNGVRMPVGVTIGVAFCPDDAMEPGRLLASADAAMYLAKAAGRNCYRKAAHV